MTSEQRDPREAVLDEYTVFPGAAPKLLARVDAADPIRAILPEVVEALEVLEQLVSERDGAMLSDILHVQLLLTKLRTFHTTTGGTDDGE